MGGATRLMTLLTTPIPPLRPSFVLLRRHLSSVTVAPRRLLTLSSPSKTKTKIPQLVKSLHSQSTNTTHAIQSSVSQHQQNHPWPEWTNFLNILSSGQGLSAPEDPGIPPEDAFVVYEELSDNFVRAAAACIAFARARPNLLGLLSRRDIEAVVGNGTPFLFKSAINTARRMRAFLETDGSNESELDKAYTIDLMKYILSYASNATVSSERNGLYSRGTVDSSVRNLLHELGTICNGVPTGYMPASRHIQKPFGQNIEMKRGDWICRKCNFMNFAKNMKCLECEESRPQKQLTGGEWECPQCNFFNYGRNLVCLRCDCRRPGPPLFNNNTPQFNSGYNGNFSNKSNIDRNFADNEQRAQRWFSKISQLNTANNGNNSASQHQTENKDEKKQAEISEMKTESFQFPKNSPSQINIQNQEREQTEKSERWFKKMAELHGVKDLPKYKRQVAMDQTNNTNSVPFVPFPPGYFAKKDYTDQSDGQDSSVKADTEVTNSEFPKSNYSSKNVANTSEVPRTDNQPTSSASLFSGNNVGPAGGSLSQSSENENVGNKWNGKGLEGLAVKEPDPVDMSEEAKAERWFKRVAQIKDISELSQIPDEDFPSIMPMRKGVNRFVVSKRKTPLDRRLTSQQYRRSLPVVSSESVKKERDDS